MELQSGNKAGAGLGDSDGGPALPEEVAVETIADFRLRIEGVINQWERGIRFLILKSEF